MALTLVAWLIVVGVCICGLGGVSWLLGLV